MCRVEIQNKREVEGEIELVHFQLVPVDWRGLYSQRERGREMLSSVLAHTEYSAPCTLHRALSVSNSTHSALPHHIVVLQTQTHHCHVESLPKGDTDVHGTTSQVGFIHPSIHSFISSFLLKPPQCAPAGFFFFGLSL